MLLHRRLILPREPILDFILDHFEQIYFDAGAPIDKVVAPAAMPMVDALARECLEPSLSPSSASTPVSRWTPPSGRENTPDVLPYRMPVLLAQGTVDTTVRPADAPQPAIAESARDG